MIRFEKVVDRIDFSHCDTLMFTSKQAVVTADAIDPAWKSYPVIAIGPATKRQVEALGGEVIYHPAKYYGEVLAQDIAQQFRKRRILYLRPETVSFDSKHFLAQAGIELQEQIIYRTACVRYERQDRPPPSSIVIFTSPSTIRCFLENFEWDSSYTAVVIGESTKVHLPPGARYTVAARPMIDACIETAKKM
jgi:uroporphyrinogen-III synthase